jgi:hypothetical protein
MSVIRPVNGESGRLRRSARPETVPIIDPRLFP